MVAGELGERLLLPRLTELPLDRAQPHTLVHRISVSGQQARSDIGLDDQGARDEPSRSRAKAALRVQWSRGSYLFSDHASFRSHHSLQYILTIPLSYFSFYSFVFNIMGSSGEHLGLESDKPHLHPGASRGAGSTGGKGGADSRDLGRRAREWRSEVPPHTFLQSYT